MSACKGPGCDHPEHGPGGLKVLDKHIPQKSLSRRERRKQAKAQAKGQSWTKAWRSTVAEEMAGVISYGGEPVDMNAVMKKIKTDSPDMDVRANEKRDQKVQAILGDKQDTPALPPGWQSWPLTDIRRLAQSRNVRVNGKRPSLCNKTDLINALENL